MRRIITQSGVLNQLHFFLRRDIAASRIFAVFEEYLTMQKHEKNTAPEYSGADDDDEYTDEDPWNDWLATSCDDDSCNDDDSAAEDGDD